MGNKQNNTSEITERKLPKFKILDAVIILLILAAVIGVYFRYSILDLITNNREQKDYAISFSIEDIKSTTEMYIKIGDMVYDAETGDPLGTLIKADDSMEDDLLISVASEFFTKDDGTVIEVLYPENTRIDVKGRMLCRGTYTEEGGFLLGGSKYLSPGQKITVQTELVTVSITIEEIMLYE